MFATDEHEQMSISHLNDNQIAFLTYNLFIDILPKAPSLEFKLEDLENICGVLFENKGKEPALYISQLHEGSDITKNTVQDPEFSQIVLRLHQRSQQAKAYFEYLLDKLPPEHTDRSSIYNNMALIYAMQNEKTKAEKTYDEALKFAQSVKSDSAVIEYKDQTCIINPTANVTLPKTSIDHSTALGNIADIYYHKGDYKSAVEHYKQALELSTDLQCRAYFQQMIVTLRKSI
ncbi:unnamed protein product [Rotaria sordida]|uniref:Tetratricopeptide repeat protein n=1 Tax=Rotaria sordida TaxID=392033 RepID=A0A815DKK0_9BILA|nr:unnamed protein product [Rotaria sordida]